MKKIVTIGENGESPKNSMKMKQEVVNLKSVVHGLLCLDTLGIERNFFHICGHQSWMITEDVGSMGSSTGVDKGSPYDSTRRLPIGGHMVHL